MPTLYRVCAKAYSPASPEGAALHGGRWNSIGTPMIYCSFCLSTAVLERLANGYSFSDINRQDAFSTVKIDEREFADLDETFFQDETWRSDFAKTREFGDTWIRSQKKVLALPVLSAVLPLEKNCLLNPTHPKFASLDFSPLAVIPLDERLLGAS